ncbi:uncharacterized protein TNCV_4742051 [Trichonephila clavipes]|nr:uncharacterized protein TNCV_4742051 [Trichonephila clavipes]
MPPDRQRPDEGTRNSSWQRAVVSRSFEHHAECPHAAKALYIYKHPCLLRDSNPVPTAPHETKTFSTCFCFGNDDSQITGGTYDAIVYEYDRKHPRELVYVALSRVTNIEGLFMVTKENTEDSWKFWIGRSGIPLNASESDKHLKRSTSHREDLTLELKN